MTTKSLLVAGYRQHEVGIFSDKDPRLTIIKTAIRKDLLRWLEEGLEWLVFSGNVGFEYWVLEVALELREDYPLRLAVIFPFETHGQHWNEANQEKLAVFQSLDFVKYAYPSYEHAGQFRQHGDFLLEHTDGAYIFYDVENETNLKHLLHQMETKEGYTKKVLTFEELNEVAEELAEKNRENEG